MKTNRTRTMTSAALLLTAAIFAAAVFAAVSAVSCELAGDQAASPPENTGPWVVTYDTNGGEGTAPGSVTWTGGAGLTLPQKGSMAKDDLFFGGWAGGDPTAHRVSNPYIPTADITLYARWIDLDSILENARAQYEGATKVIGNPDDNTPEAQMISASIVALETAMLGEEHTRYIDGDQDRPETYYEYDLDAIDAASEAMALLLENFSGEIIVPTMRFDYIQPDASNGNDPAQQATLRSAGVYEIELLGAAGGHVWTKTNKTGTGGKGGYIKAEYTFSPNTDVAVRVGGMGQGTAYYDGTHYTGVYPPNDWTTSVNGRKRGDAHPGGYNGGGGGGGSDGTSNSAGSGGGGATDIRLWSQRNASLTGVSGDPRIAVAAGGGGAAQGILPFPTPTDNNPALPGGNGGGTTGGNGAGDIPANAATGGTQTSGGTPTAFCSAGMPGVGWTGINGNQGVNGEGRGGGGGGWWGGAAGTQNTTIRNIISGAGGSSYTDGTGTITPTGDVVNETNAQNFWDNGWARITWKGN